MIFSRFDDEIHKDLKENYRILDIKSIKMDELEENLTGEENYEEGADAFMKSDSQDDQLDEGTVEYLDLDMEAIQEAEEYQPVPILNSQKKRKRPKEKSPSHSSILKNTLKTNYDTQGELKFRPKYRPIRPKPYQSPPKANKLQSLPSIVNFNPAPGFIVAAPTVVRKDTKGQETFVTSPAKGINYSKVTNGVNVVGKTNSGNLATKSDLRNGKLQSRTTPKNSVELFFESMAKTVLNLPTQVQAEIKMEICKVISMAEIKYLSGVHSKSGKKG